MKCYNHHDRDAFGVCRVCGKGLCLECMSEKKDHGIHCKDDNHSGLKTKQFFAFFLTVVSAVLLIKVLF